MAMPKTRTGWTREGLIAMARRAPVQPNWPLLQDLADALEASIADLASVETETIDARPVDAAGGDWLTTLEELAKSATPGPWFPYETMQADCCVTAGGGLLTGTIVCGPTYEKVNTQFIAAANPVAVLLLIAELRSARARLDALVPSARACPEVGCTRSDTHLHGCCFMCGWEHEPTNHEIGRQP